ncbi:MAG TPA: protoporphyrinogen oxidase HemJ [Sulfurovum sp.]|jgi:putative membrane protein|nr:MAG: TIGR00701 family protein [Sulfurovum sp. 35-42-20]OYY57431.1 MAG: TIGR00701 family protein [Sulfurovum sp. 28-43-6]OYZ25142.1 MAG: TIGR00701 family protein [Sulfurovum sp. 16-42-52]OYZ50156.1 MAG: TIGR00701 family protein [Sulfurovum sp. 24-42-9]OZA60064.1 MAG: TIGR00701 family protein [Sulfurovum sp. 39-42-12]HQR73074.1 protoporphyrinogen oxidase HemJ [Sulfurovum sp.]
MAYYSWILAFHVMSFVSWMAMLFYLPRLFIYHRENADIKAFTDIVQIQEYKLFKYIGAPAMWATLLSGSVMLYLNSAILSSGGWIHVKLFLLVFLIAYHFSLEQIRKILITNPRYKSSKYFRLYNEVPTLLMIGIVIMVVIKPF